MGMIALTVARRKFSVNRFIMVEDFPGDLQEISVQVA